jgi:hypothetical protein
MLEYKLENNTARWEIKRLNNETARRYRVGLTESTGEKQLLTDLASVCARILLRLGRTLTSAGKRLSDGRASSRATTA